MMLTTLKTQILFLCVWIVCLHMCLCTPPLQCPWRPEDSILSRCNWSYSWYSEQPYGCWQSSSRRRASILNSQATAPVPPPSHIFLNVELLCMCGGAVHTCRVWSSQKTTHGTQLSSSLLSLCEFQGLSSGHQVWQEIPLPAECNLPFPYPTSITIFSSMVVFT